ncbi:MAG TPA: hypothetical protein VKZ76_02355 [Edaphocola sp.]|nr:hypothetical protein [Edaphocola sp.]
MKQFNFFRKLGSKPVQLLTFGILLGLSACKKDKDTQNQVTSPEAYRSLTQAGLSSLMQTATFNIDGGTFVFESNKGTMVYIHTDCLRKDGAAATGTARLEFYEAYEYADMVIANKATMGYNAENVLEPLRTGGQFFVRVTQDGAPLDTDCAISIETSCEHTGGYDGDMVGWIGQFIKDDLVWNQSDDVNVGANDRSEPGYFLEALEFGWFNIDKLYDDPRPRIPLNISVPVAYVEACTVYAIIKGEPYSLGLAGYGEWPIGLEIYLIFVSENNGQYQWEIKEHTVQQGQTINFNLANAQTGNITQLRNALSALQ